MRAVTTVYADGTLPIERTESTTAQAKHEQYEQWYARVNAECDCNKAEKCGDKYRVIVQGITAKGAISNDQLCKKLNCSLSKLTYWRTGSRHFRKQSATCDHAHMPQELLPRLRCTNTLSPGKSNALHTQFARNYTIQHHVGNTAAATGAVC
jgi:diaminopimelate epimerase